MHIKMVLRRALRHQGQVVRRRVAKEKVGGTHDVQAASGNVGEMGNEWRGKTKCRLLFGDKKQPALSLLAVLAIQKTF